jgi:hypothetical protein
MTMVLNPASTSAGLHHEELAQPIYLACARDPACAIPMSVLVAEEGGKVKRQIGRVVLWLYMCCGCICDAAAL